MSLSEEEYAIAEVNFLHFKHPTHFGSKSHGHADFVFKKNESFIPLNFNVYINLDNRERARVRNK